MVVVHSDRISAKLELRPALAAGRSILDDGLHFQKQSAARTMLTTSGRFENELKVPYYLRFATDTKELTLLRHNGKKYAKVRVSRQ